MSDTRSKIRAAQYVRMSTERQDYSVEYQKVVIASYALERGYEIVRTFEDAGISGLTISRRAGLSSLVQEVVSGTADFNTILVYDVSRWGRFQNPDQSAHYEFICAEAGVAVEYCAEPFENDGSPTSALLKHIKRAMAAEYSRELSEKVARAKRGLVQLGYWQGASPGYGLRRQAVTRGGRIIGIQELGEWRAQVGARTRLVPGPPEEVAVVRRIYRMFLKKGGSYSAIARRLNGEAIPAEHGAAWTSNRVRQILTNEKYCGSIVSGKSRDYLGRRVHRLPESEWIRVPNAIEPIVTKHIFGLVRHRILQRNTAVTAEDALNDLRRILTRNGRVTEHLVRSQGRWSPQLYARRFGGLRAAYAMIGYVPEAPRDLRNRDLEKAWAARKLKFTDSDLLARVRELWRREGYLSQQLINRETGMPAASTLHRRFGSLAKVYELVGYIPTARQEIGSRFRSCKPRGWPVPS